MIYLKHIKNGCVVNQTQIFILRSAQSH